MNFKVEMCGVNTAHLPSLTAEETKSLLIRAQGGDLSARDALITGNLRLVLSVLQRFGSRGENADDLFQVGCIGLMKAIDNFDTTLGLRFSTYGVPMIIGEIRRYLRDYSPIRVSRGTRDMAVRVMQAREKLMNETQEEPTPDELASFLGVSRQEVTFALNAIAAPISLQEPVSSDSGEGGCIMDQIGDTKNSDESWLTRIALDDVLRSLGEREKRILALRYLSGMTQMETASELGISQAQVSRLENAALNKIREETK